MIWRTAVWSVVFATAFAALPSYAAISQTPHADDDPDCVKVELPPAPVSISGRESGGHHQRRVQAGAGQKFSWLRIGQSCRWLVFMLCLAAGLIWSRPAAAQMFEDDDGFIPPPTSLTETVRQFDDAFLRLFEEKPGAKAHERALWSTHNIPVVDPMEFVHINALECDDPESFWYTYRPNLFNIDVEDEWDWYNLINTDRSDFTDTPFTVGRGNTYLETGYTFARTTGIDQPTEVRTAPEALLRHGVTDDLELRFKWNGYIGMDVKDPAANQTLSMFGTQDTDLGFKYTIFHQRNWFPLTTLVAGALFPTGTRGFSGNQVQPHFNLVTGWGIRRYIYLKSQFGYDYFNQPSFSVENSPAGLVLAGTRTGVDSFHSSISMLYQATKYIGGFVEWYCLYGHSQPTTHFADTGLFIYLSPSVQLDCVIGSSIDSSDPEILFAKAGFSTRW